MLLENVLRLNFSAEPLVIYDNTFICYENSYVILFLTAYCNRHRDINYVFDCKKTGVITL